MIRRSSYPGWNEIYPVFHARTYAEYQEVGQWMADNRVEAFLLQSGSSGYTFQVRSNIEWFLLRWSS